MYIIREEVVKQVVKNLTFNGPGSTVLDLQADVFILIIIYFCY